MPDSPTVEIVDVTPQLAETWLSRNPKNRNLRGQVIASYARDMAAGNWMPQLVEMAGGINLVGTAGKHSPWLTWEQLVAIDPDVIVILPCGFDIERTRGEMGSLARLPQWPDLRAARTGRVFLTDGNQYFNRPGPRLVESLEILAEILHSDTFAFGHEGKGWDRFA